MFPNGSYTQIPDIYNFFKDVSIINNSWGINFYPYFNLKASNSGLVDCTQTNQGTSYNICNTPLEYVMKADKVANDMMRLSKDKGVLNVFAAGNEGILALLCMRFYQVMMNL